MPGLDNWPLVLSMTFLIGGIVGWWLCRIGLRITAKRRLSQQILNYVMGHSNEASHVKVSRGGSRDQRLVSHLYDQCVRGEFSRAYTLIQQISDRQRPVEIDYLQLKLGIELNRYDHLTETLRRLHPIAGVERLAFGSLVCAGQWSEAVEFYRVHFLRRQGSLREWRMLRLCADVFGGIPLDGVELSSAEEHLYRLLSQADGTSNQRLQQLDLALDMGVCFVSELRFLLDDEKSPLNVESSTHRQHPTTERVGRSDWLSPAYGTFRQQMRTAGLEWLAQDRHSQRVHEWLNLHRGYQCAHCGQPRRGFSLVCSSCWSLEFGVPVQLPPLRSGTRAVPVQQVDLAVVERRYWMSLLMAT